MGAGDLHAIDCGLPLNRIPVRCELHEMCAGFNGKGRTGVMSRREGRSHAEKNKITFL